MGDGKAVISFKGCSTDTTAAAQPKSAVASAPLLARLRPVSATTASPACLARLTI
ncbi:MAG: hypothetical protein IKD04_05195 [Clostridia bacterium]|nr:hypothetical protein [Clostridia bacterium]